MADYKLSIIIPTFNLEKMIEKTFHSVTTQTIGFENIELIFVDDQSTDNTIKFLKNYEKNYSNVKLFTTEKNSGFAGRPRNIGIKNSTSEYVLFLDGDDQLLIDSCEVLYNQIRSTNSDIVIGGHINKYENKKLEHNSPLYSGRNETFTEVQDANLLNITPAITAKLYKKELLSKNNIKFPEEMPGQDLVFLLESILNSNKITVLNNFYVYYRNINTNSVSFNLNEKYLTGLINIYKIVCDNFEKHNVDEEIQEVILTNHMGFLTTQLIRSSTSPNFDKENLKNIVNSELFNELANEPIFKKNPLYVEFFENIKNEKYNNRPLLAKIRESINTDLINGNENYFKNIISELSNENESLKKSNENLTETQNELQKNYDSLNQDYEVITNEKNELQSNLNTLNNQYNTLTNEKNQLQNNFNTLTNEKNQLQDNFNTLTNEKNQLQDNFNTLTNEKNQLQNNLNTLNNQYNTLTNEKSQLQDNLNTLNNQYNTLTNEKNQLQNNFNTLTNEKNQLQNNFNTLTNEKNQLQNNFNRLTNEHNALKNHDADITYLNKKLNNNINELESEYNALNGEYENLMKFNSKLNDDLEVVKSDFVSMKKLQIRIDDENKFLKIKNQNLNNELDEIKSSLLWKMKNKF